MVSMTTAVTIGIIQGYTLLVGVVCSGVANPCQKKAEACYNEDERTVAMMAQHCIACLATYSAMIVGSSIFQCLVGMFAVLMLGRFLRMSGIMTTASSAIPLALVLGAAAKMCLPEDYGNTGDGVDQRRTLKWNSTDTLIGVPIIMLNVIKCILSSSTYYFIQCLFERIYML